MSNNANNNLEIIYSNEISLADRNPGTMAEFLTSSSTYDIIESVKYFINQSWDYFLEFGKFFLETNYIDKSSSLSFIVNGAVKKLHEIGDNNINATIDRIVAKIDNLVNPNVNNKIESCNIEAQNIFLIGETCDIEL